MSNKNAIGFIIILVLALAAFSQFATALSEDFVLFSQKQDISACSCGITADTYTIRNTGAVTSTYQIIKSGSASAYSTLSQDYFALEPGQAKEIINYINFPCSVQGNYNLDINVTTLFGLSKEFEQKVAVGNCINFKIIPKETYQQKCPCTPTRYEIEIENTGSFTETYMLNVTTQRQYASVSESAVILAPGEKKSVFIFFNLPCGVFGKQDLEVDVIAEKSQQIAEVPLTLDIGSCYDYVLEADSQFNLCEGKSIAAPITISNKAAVGNTFTVSVNKAFVKLTNETFFLWGNESGSASMLVDAEKLKQGEYAFDIKAVSERGNDEQIINAELVVERCYDFSLKIEEPQDKIIAGKDYIYKLNIENKGTKQATFDISTEGPSWIRLSSDNVVIDSKETKTVDLVADIPANASGKAYFKVIVDEEGLFAEKELSMNIIDVNTAHELKISEKKTTVLYGADQVTVELKNKGVSSGDYVLSLTSPSWASLSESTVHLESGETKTVSINTDIPDGTEEGKYKINFLASIPEGEIGYSKDFEVKVISAPWYKKAYAFALPYVLAYWLYALIAVAAIAVLIILIWLLRKMVRKIKQRKKEKPLLVVAEEKKKAKVEEPKFKEFVTPSIAEAEPYRLSLHEPKKKRALNWSKFFKIFFLILILAGIASLIWFNWSGIQSYASGIFGEKNQTPDYAPEVEINRSTGVEGYGNVIYIREEGDLDIPVTIKNRAPVKVVYAIRIANSTLISTNVSALVLDVNETQTLHLIVHATPELSDGVYEITLGLNINERDLKYSEKIELRIEKQKSTFERYLPYIIIGLIVAAVLILILSLTRRSKFEKKREKLDLKVTRVKERKSLKKPLGIAALIIAILLLGFGAYVYISSLPEPVDEGGSIDLSSFENQTMNLKLKQNQRVIIPLNFENLFDSTAEYDITSDADWITVTDSSFNLRPGMSAEVNITADPAAEAEEGMYTVEIKGDVDSEGISYTKKINFYLRKTPVLKFFQNKYFVIGVVAIIIGLLLLLSSKKRRKERKEFIEEIKHEIKHEIKETTKPKPKLVAAVPKKTKIKLGAKKKK
ncbi:hypothetical protein KY308_03310 [Candidatus Woesearchaeota archaeon]|nr:hypothetical protein [Candidatus Woesearchaeota archaeon]